MLEGENASSIEQKEGLRGLPCLHSTHLIRSPILSPAAEGTSDTLGEPEIPLAPISRSKQADNWLLFRALEPVQRSLRPAGRRLAEVLLGDLMERCL